MLAEGDQEYSVPAWKQKLHDQEMKEGRHSIGENESKQYYIQKNEVAVKHPKNNSMVKISDSGVIDIFAGPALGIKINPRTESVNIYAENLNFFGKKMNIKTLPEGLIWNGYHFNPELYYENDTERGQRIVGTKEYYHMTHESDPEDRSVAWHTDSWSVQPMKRSDSSGQYSEGMIQILKDLGLPAE